MQANTDPTQDRDDDRPETEADLDAAHSPEEQSDETETQEENTGQSAEEPTSPEKEAAKWKEVSLRTAAEMDNLRKRTAREREDAVRYANARLLEELLPVIDNFEMGMQAASEDTSSMIYIGMDMVRKQLGEFLSAQGVKEVPTDGLFDPNLHDAVAQEPCDKGEEGRILKVNRRGYMLKDRLLRPASVVVSRLPENEDGDKDGEPAPDKENS
ncbi:MAG: nucleotide exchange factor GrpE [Akkermansiaceae bacterium]|nr:nucleotide exchange factor GrpE [Akkermansiaceae bacterium]